MCYLKGDKLLFDRRYLVLKILKGPLELPFFSFALVECFLQGLSYGLSFDKLFLD